MIKNYLFILCAVLFLGCSANENECPSSAKYMSAAEKIYDLANDYGLNISLASGFDHLSSEELDIPKIEMKLRKFAALKGTYNLIPNKKSTKGDSIIFTCRKPHVRLRAMSSNEFEKYNYEFESENLNDGLRGYCSAMFVESYYYQNCTVVGRIEYNNDSSTSESHITTISYYNGLARFDGTVSYSYEERDLFSNPAGCKNDSCLSNCACPLSCKYGCECKNCKCGSNGDIKFFTITVIYHVTGECTRNGGKIEWKYESTES